MDKSYNGWTASPNPADFGGLVALVVAGEAFAPGVRAGDVRTVLSYVAEQLHARVEPVVKSEWHQADDWGYNYRKNRNADNLSCHASGTAIDYNATRHPNGKAGTFSPAQFAVIEKILDEVGNVVRQLRGYDEMHFEICADERAVAAVAAGLRTGVPPARPVVSEARTLVYKPGAPVMEGDDVRAVQRVLNAWYPWVDLVEDGQYGKKSADAVRDMQGRAGLKADGEVGPKTRKILGL